MGEHARGLVRRSAFSARISGCGHGATDRAGRARNQFAWHGIGNAGKLTGTGSGTIGNGSDDWWVIYPSSLGRTVSVTIADNAAADSSCTQIYVILTGSESAGNDVTAAAVNPASSAEVSGPAGGSDRYYVEVHPDQCASTAPYTITLNSGGGGTPPSPSSGTLPPGLKLNGHNGVVSGKPSKRGTYKFTVEITDSTKPRHKWVTDVFTITIT